MLADNSNVDGVDDQTAAEHDNHATELQAVVTDTGVTCAVSLPDPNTHQLGQAITDHSIRVNYCVDSGTSTAYVLTPAFATIQTPTAYGTGMLIAFIPLNSNSSNNPSVNVAGLGVKHFRRPGGGRYRAFDIEAGRLCFAVYGLSDFHLLSPNMEFGPGGYIDGFTHAPDSSGSPLTDVLMGVRGHCRDESERIWMYMFNTLAMRKEIDNVWALGTSNGGYPSTLNVGGAGAGVVAADTWYRFFAIWNEANGIQCDFGWDTDAAAANLLIDASAYTHYRQIAWHLTDGSADLIPYYQDPDNPDYILWDAPYEEFEWINLDSTSEQLVDIDRVPPGATGHFLHTLRYEQTGGATDLHGLVTPTFVSDTAPSATVYNARCRSEAGEDNLTTQVLDVKVDDSGQIRARYDTTNDNGDVWIHTLGYTYRRGKG